MKTRGRLERLLGRGQPKAVEAPPLRAELFSIAQLERHAETLATWHAVDERSQPREDGLLARLAENEALLAEGYALVTDAAVRGRQITPAAEWFLDNYHLIEEQIRLARRHLPRGYSRELPQLVNAPATGTPRIYDIALELISHAHGRVDAEALCAFVRSYQSVQPLLLGELWAIAIMLRLALIENLRRVVAAVMAGRRDRERAAAWAERLLEVTASDPARAVLVLADIVEENPPLSNAFVAELASRLSGHGSAVTLPMSWLEHRLAERGQTIEHVFQWVSQDQAADQVSIANSIGSLRFLAATDWRRLVESLSVVERALEKDALYASMDFATRDRYRHVVEQIARTSDCTEHEVAARAVELAQQESAGRRSHVGYFLVDRGRRALEDAVRVRPPLFSRVARSARRARAAIYGGSIALLTAGVSAALLSAAPVGGWDALPWGVLIALCASQLAIAITHWAATSLVRPRVLPRLDFADGIPEDHRAVVAVPVMLADPASIDEMIEALEVRYLANRDGHLAFALVTDLRDAPSRALEGDDALLERAKAGVQALRDKHRGAPFFLLHRARQWNEREGAWMGWERKRGKLEDFNALLRGELDRFHAVVGPVEELEGTRYVIALDCDTALPRDSARQLVATMAHPLNRPVIDEARGRVVEGYGILQPRVAITMASANSTRFAGLFAGEPGIDPYTRAVSDVYQDVFDEGSFVGKGIYDVDAVQRTMAGRFPENRVLSHDLLESAYARAGLASDILLFEEYPSSYLSDAARRARWTRGDWQIARWLWPSVPSADGSRVRNPISALSRWKIFDNLRRSLVPIALVALLIAGWMVPGMAVIATCAVLAALLVPPLLSAASGLARRPDEVSWQQHLAEVGRTAWRSLTSDALLLAWLPFDAVSSVIAIVRSSVRLLITRRRLLEWRTAADAQRAARTTFGGTYTSMWSSLAIAALALGVVYLHRESAWLAAPFIVAWIAGPALAWGLGRPIVRAAPSLSASDHTFLRTVARRTWRFFETYVAEEDHYLPPDNVQEDPPVGVAHRTSPTNIGLSLTASLAAYDLGYVTAGELIARTTRTLASLDRLPRHRGHFYNWYDTRTLEPLRPMYVSTVDSGNLTGHLSILAAGLNELATRPLVRPELFAGIGDTLDVIDELGASIDLTALRKALEQVPTTPSAMYASLQRLIATVERTKVGADATPEIPAWLAELDTQCRRALTELVYLAPWLALPKDGVRELAELDALGTLTALARTELAPDREDVAAALELASERAAARLEELRALAARAIELGDYDCDLLYDKDRRLMSIGYDVASHRLDASFYDLLASEARLASYLAIAHDKLPEEHWFHLGRLLTTAGGRPALLSWSGSMFEYLMPMLVMPSYEGTLLDTTCRAAVARQIEYGRERGVPWGVSESGYFKTDAHLNYQYRAFGVPGLGFKRGLADDLVVAPYASAMALMVAPEEACTNLRRLAREGQLGPYGFYEAIDYTPSRLPPGKESVTVRSYMVHHQGMAFLAFAHLLAGRPMQRRFDADPALRAAGLLLQERVPRTPPIHPHPAEVSVERKTTADEPGLRVFDTPSTPSPEVHLLSNGSYHVAVTNAGGGYSRWRDLAVTRWREDPTCDAWGTFVYVRDVSRGADGSFWSVAHQPTLQGGASYEAIFSPGRAEFRRRVDALDTHVEISVSPEDDVELRQISVTNLGDARTIELTTYAEVVLSPPAADASHRTFSNLFVQTELVRQHQAILCTRRPRSGGEKPPWMIHLMTVHGALAGPTSYETGRAEFLGRGRTAADPEAMHRAALTDSEGSVLDPIVAIRNRVALGADEMVRVHVVTGVAETREAAMALIEKYTDRHLAGRVLELAWTQSQVLQRRLEATAAEIQLYERLAGNVLYSSPTLRAQRSVIARNRRGQSSLWAYGISGDLPIVLVRIGDTARVELVRQMVRAHAYWRQKGLAVDLVIWNEDPSGYRQELHEQIMASIAAVAEGGLVDRPGGIFVRRIDQMSEEDSVLVQTVARVIITDSAGTLAEQIERRPRGQRVVPAFVAQRKAEPASALPATKISRPDLALFNGLGGFTRDGREYVITTTRDARTPAPWVNVLANAYFGTVVSESGAAYTWCENAHMYRLTPWNNDPVTDASGEALYLRDEEDGRFWSPTPHPAPGTGSYACRHGFGYSVFEHTEDGLTSELSTFVATDAPVKFVWIKLRNRSGRARRVSLTASYDLVLGSQRSQNLPHIVTEVDLKTGALIARNPYAAELASRVAFLESSEQARTITGDRLEVLGRNGDPSSPLCMKRARLSGRVGAALDPCLAMQVTIELADGQERDVALIFGSGRDLDDARHIVSRFRGIGPARAALEGVWAYWNRTLGAVNVQTPDPALNFLANGWLVYQTIACRLWGRSGFYQSGGAFGFRDQLQDACALLHAEPALLREQIVRAAAHQFREGDVQHWWHPPSGRGVRTRISDDYLWLPYATCRYVAALGDTGVLDERVDFLDGRPVKPDEDSYYDLPTRAPEAATIYEHCVRAIENGLRFGVHGLPLMGTGDWNDGMNLVGDHGKGESVWLAFFLYDVLVRFEVIARMRGDTPFAETCLAEAAKLRVNIEQHGWDGEWYRRAYFDNGDPLGSITSPECKIDAIPQSWSALTRAGDPDRSRRALAAVDAQLVDRELAVIKLFDPPFDRSELEPGYVKGYVPGVRENGGQYTHAAVWTAMAFAAIGDTERAWELFGLINPIRHADDRQSASRYMVEPYVVAADVYTSPQHAGRGGWTWYTGSAGWMYRLIVESLLGIRLEVDHLRLEPLLPASWDGFDVHYRFRDTVHHIHVKARGAGGDTVVRVVADGVDRPDLTVPLHDDRQEHWIVVEVGSADRELERTKPAADARR
jgi:cyclic beta-1,2-glucan synthetase